MLSLGDTARKQSLRGRYAEDVKCEDRLPELTRDKVSGVECRVGAVDVAGRDEAAVAAYVARERHLGVLELLPERHKLACDLEPLLPNVGTGAGRVVTGQHVREHHGLTEPPGHVHRLAA